MEDKNWGISIPISIAHLSNPIFITGLARNKKCSRSIPNGRKSAVWTLKQLSMDEDTPPTLRENFYMDDILSGASNLKEAKEV
ncbi:hypothetical protein CDAR_120731 [Caerostris darwini]|uniref:Uncharacterized protein n=1 Tax=Caerostris darwini TaxID=1538125 RepID=A0AAV4RWC9_9ARAC|nr:hypothetical protein CDAR_120731 [Caerostris darwini]